MCYVTIPAAVSSMTAPVEALGRRPTTLGIGDDAGDGSVHVLDSVDAEASGPSYSVPRLCDALARRGARVALLTIGERVRPGEIPHEVHRHDYAGVPLLRRLRFSRQLRSRLADAARSTSVVHAHGLWLMANIYPAGAAARAGRPLVLSPRGMLGPAALRFSSRRKQIFWTLLQNRAVRSAACLHATSEQELLDIRAFGLSNPVAIVPNGVDVSSSLEPKHSKGDRRCTLLYLGRLHPKKGLDLLVDAWKTIAPTHPEWSLEIVGPVDSTYARSLGERLTRIPRARLAGPLYGLDKAAAYRQADLFVLPTLNENFAMTVAEALAQGTPAVATKGAPWSGLERHGCGWWVDGEVDALATALVEAMAAGPARLAAMGEAGRDWMRRDFDWDIVAQSMACVYRWLSGAGPKPSCVYE